LFIQILTNKICIVYALAERIGMNKINPLSR